MAPETFDSEIGDVHEGRGDRGTFSDEFRGASDSLLEDRRPVRPLDVGRRGRRVLTSIVLALALLGGGGFALWYWAEPIGEWIASIGRATEPEPEPAPEVEPEPEADPEPAAEKVFGVPAGASDDGGVPAEPAEPEAPTEPAAPAASAKIQAGATEVSGKVSGGAVDRRLAVVDAALPACWAQAQQAGARGPVEIVLKLRIKWSGRSGAVSVSGGSDALRGCVRAAVPGAGWPQPRDGGEAKVTRRWTLGGA